MNYFIAAIGTGSGKTIVSSVLVEALKSDYWKPVQAGFPTDSDTVNTLVSNEITKIHREKHLLKTPESPHAAAQKDGINIEIEDFVLPETSKQLIVEGAGGLLVPLNNHHTMIDLIQHLNLPVILVSNLYLGSINHTLLSCELMKARGINVHGIIFNGIANKESMDIIEKLSGLPILYHLPKLDDINSQTIKDEAVKLRNLLPAL